MRLLPSNQGVGRAASLLLLENGEGNSVSLPFTASRGPLVHALLSFKADNGLSLFSITSLWPPLLPPFSIFKDPCDPGFKVGWFAPFLPSATLSLLCCALYVTRFRIRKGPLFWLWRSSLIILCFADFSSITALTNQHWAPSSRSSRLSCLLNTSRGQYIHGFVPPSWIQSGLGHGHSSQKQPRW